MLWCRRRCPDVSFLPLPQIYCGTIHLHACGVFPTPPSHGRAISYFLWIARSYRKAYIHQWKDICLNTISEMHRVWFGRMIKDKRSFWKGYRSCGDKTESVLAPCLFLSLALRPQVSTEEGTEENVQLGAAGSPMAPASVRSDLLVGDGFLEIRASHN